MTTGVNHDSGCYMNDEHSNRLIVCLGAHRSGTSMLAASIAALGAETKIEQTYANPENQKGFFEHPRLIILNDLLLERLGSTWDAPCFDYMSSARDVDFDDIFQDAVEFVKTMFGDVPLGVIKDPRVCMVLPFWARVFEHCGYAKGNVKYIHILRSPYEAAVSQYIRSQNNPIFYEFGKDIGEGAILWMTYVQTSFAQYDEANTQIIWHKDLIENPVSVGNEIAQFMDVPVDGFTEFAADFFDTKMYRSTVLPEQKAEIDAVLPQAGELFERFGTLYGHATPSQKQIDQVFAKAGAVDAADLLGPILLPALQRISLRWRNEHRRTLHLDQLALGKSKELDKANDTMRQILATYAKERANQEMRLNLAQSELESLRANMDGNQARQKNDNEQKLPQDEITKLLAKINFLTLKIDQQDIEFERIQGENQHLSETIALFQKRSQKRNDELEQQAELLTLKQALLQSVEESERHLRSRLDDSTNAKFDLVQKVESLTRDNQLLTNQLLTIQGTRTYKSWNAITNMTSRILSKSTQVARLNKVGRWGYRTVKSISPKAANGLRDVFEPRLRKINRSTWNTDVPPLPSQLANLENLFQYDFQLPKVVSDVKPLVTVIVPNFNHADYLVKRLESIYAQTYTNFEVILMDDCSTDVSREVLQSFANRYPENTRVVFNDKNSGGVFFQWKKGIAMAKGSLIWIAESDDWCSENFLETMVPFFENPAVQISYTKTDFMNGAGDTKIWSMEEYLQDLGPERWGHSFVETAPDIVKSAFGVKNIIPNASSAVFRKFDALGALGANDWTKMNTCGDWLFYLNVIRGGMVAYSPDARNYYRIHDKNTSVTSYSKDSFYQEHETIARFINRTYTVDSKIFEQQEQNLITHWKQNRKSYKKSAFTKTYDLKRILKEAENRKPNLLMAGFAFCAGGGETFPIQLANLMKDYGYNVTFLDCGREEEVPEIRNMLRADIPVISNFADLSRIVQHFDIGIIHSHNAWVDNTILDVLPNDTPAKTVVSLHGMYETIDAEYRKTILPRLVERTGCLVYTAEKNLGALLESGLIDKEDIPRIDNALVEFDFEPFDRATLNIPEDAFVLTNVSRAFDFKGWAEGIEAVEIARAKTGADIRLILIGEGPEFDRLQAAGVPGFVYLEGFQSNIRGYFAASDLGFLPSRFHGESFPLVLIDCLIAGQPFLATSVGEIPYMLSSDHGVAGEMVDLQDWEIPVDQLAEIIGKLAVDQKEYNILKSNVPHALQKFDTGLLQQNYDAVYTDIFENNGSK